MLVRTRVAVGLLSMLAWSVAGRVTFEARQPAGQRRALLIGVTIFQDARLKPRSLKGPANDVELFKQVLQRAPLSVPATNIRILSGSFSEPALRPTHANIAREFRRLADVSGPGDQLVILMAGHGSQQPAGADAGDDEPDGFDEIFLAEDASGWDGTVGRVRNAVVDNEIRAWVNTIRAKGAFVWLIVDACQSGTMGRGFEVERQIPMAELVPADAIDPASRRAGLRGRTAKRDVVGISSSAGDVAALYAAQMTETTPERPLPNANSPVHGLFTYTIADILSQTSTAMTYRELALRVLERYRSMPRLSPTPLFEGGGLDRQIFGQRSGPDRPQVLLGGRATDGSWTLRAGSIHGLSLGTLLEVFPPAGTADANARIGYLKITAVGPTSARGVPTAVAGVAAPEAAKLAPGSRARVARYEFGDFRLRVALQQSDLRRTVTGPLPVIGPGRGPISIERALDDLEQSSSGIAQRVWTSDADWFVRVIGDRVVLVPAEGWQPTAAVSTATALDGAPSQFVIGGLGDPALRSSLGDALRRIGRARNLMRLATSLGTGPRIELRLMRYSLQTGGSGRPLLAAPADVSIRAGEFAEFRVKNWGATAVDVTVLHIDAAFGIQSLYPVRDREIDNQIKPGEERVIGRFLVNDNPLGWESVVAIAVESTPTRQNFSMLAQPSLEVRRGNDSSPSPLQEMLEQAVYGNRGRALGTDANVGSFAVRLVSWRADPAER